MASLRLNGQTALVTGAGRGIGRAIAMHLAAEGARVGLAARTASQLRETLSRIREAGGQALALPLDVADRAAVEAAISQCEAAFGPLDLLVNNAARCACIGPAWEVDPEDWWQELTVNVKGLFLCCRAAMPGMVRRGKGRIINLIGGGTASPIAYLSGYGTSKAAVMRFTECLALEARDTGVKVFAMGPGLVRTAMTELQLTTEAGRKWMPRIAEAFAQGRDVPPTLAAALAVELASGRFDALSGRAFSAGADLDRIEQLREAIVAEDAMTLRMRPAPQG